jgi:predicted ATPase
MKLRADDYIFEDLGKINVILGLNGCGKSTCLRKLDQIGKIDPDGPIEKSYITPERGGVVKYQPNIEHNMNSSIGWITDDRRKNQTTNFKAQSVAHFRMLETRILRKLDQAVVSRIGDHLKEMTFDRYLADINLLLDQIRIERGDAVFEIRHRISGQKIDADFISSGESELISLAIECLAFESSKSNVPGTTNVPLPLLILDEPDVHLHPDLQLRLVQFLRKICERSNVRIVLSTHSSPLLSALSDYEHAKIFFMKSGDTSFKFQSISEAIRGMLPVFGAHPLTSVFNKSPVLLVEGADEERIWQQAVRTSKGKVGVFPVICGNVDSVARYEQEADSMLGSIYDSAKGFSLRDGDGNYQPIDDLGRIVRFRLNCYASENLMLTNEVLRRMETDWEAVKLKVDTWVERNQDHQYFAAMKAFKDQNYDRQKHNLKDIRNILASFISNKAWEVIVGQTIGQLSLTNAQQFDIEGSIFCYLGEKLSRAILPTAELQI